MLPTICQVVHNLHIGGAELLLTELSRALRSRYRFVFACLDGAGPLAEQLRDEGHVVEVLNRQPGVDWRCGRRLARFLREQNVAAVHAHQYTPFFYTLLARGLGGRPPVIFTEHGRLHPDHPRLKRIVCNRLLRRQHDRVIGVGEAMRQALIANEGIPASSVEVLFNGVRLQPFRAAVEDSELRSQTRRELGFSEADCVVVQVARLNALKDHATAARAIARASQQDARIRWLVVGDGEERTSLEVLLREQQLEGVTRLVGTRRDVPRLLAAADVCLLSSISEGLPLTLIEAMAARLPVVATDVGGVAEVVVPEITGLLAAAGDDATLAQHLLRLSADRGLAARLGRTGAARAEHLFSFERMEAGYAAVFDDVLAANGWGQAPQDSKMAAERIAASLRPVPPILNLVVPDPCSVHIEEFAL